MDQVQWMNVGRVDRNCAGSDRADQNHLASRYPLPDKPTHGSPGLPGLHTRLNLVNSAHGRRFRNSDAGAKNANG